MVFCVENLVGDMIYVLQIVSMITLASNVMLVLCRYIHCI